MIIRVVCEFDPTIFRNQFTNTPLVLGRLDIKDIDTSIAEEIIKETWQDFLTKDMSPYSLFLDYLVEEYPDVFSPVEDTDHVVSLMA